MTATVTATDTTTNRPSLEREDVEQVRLHDLKRKGISRVRVLRPVDIERMIQEVVAEALLTSTRESEELVRRSRHALAQRMRETQAQLAAADRAEAEVERLRAASAELTERVDAERERFARAEAELRSLETEAARLEREESELPEAVTRTEKECTDLERANARRKRESAEMAARLGDALASLDRGKALLPRLEEAERRAEAAEKRRAELEAELRAFEAAA